METSSSSVTSYSSYQRRRSTLMQRGERRCRCGAQEVLWTSWTDGNPGRRFYGCPNYSVSYRCFDLLSFLAFLVKCYFCLLKIQPPRERVPQKGCGHFVWYDREMDSRAKDIINGLKVENKRLKHENKELRKVAERVQLGISPHASIEEIREEVRLLKQENVSKMELMRKQLRRACVTVIISWYLFGFFFNMVKRW